MKNQISTGRSPSPKTGNKISSENKDNISVTVKSNEVADTEDSPRKTVYEYLCHRIEYSNVVENAVAELENDQDYLDHFASSLALTIDRDELESHEAISLHKPKAKVGLLLSRKCGIRWHLIEIIKERQLKSLSSSIKDLLDSYSGISQQPLPVCRDESDTSQEKSEGISTLEVTLAEIPFHIKAMCDLESPKTVVLTFLPEIEACRWPLTISLLREEDGFPYSSETISSAPKTPKEKVSLRLTAHLDSSVINNSGICIIIQNGSGANKVMEKRVIPIGNEE